jgi:hypothetical protein
MRKFEIALSSAFLAALVLVGCQSGVPTTSDFDTQQTRATRTYRRAGMADDRATTATITAAASAWATLVHRRDPAVLASLNPTPVPTAVPTLIATPTALPTAIATRIAIDPGLILVEPTLAPLATPTPTPAPTALATAIAFDPGTLVLTSPTPAPTALATVAPISTPIYDGCGNVIGFTTQMMPVQDPGTIEPINCF